MTTPGGGDLCRNAEEHYFDLLENDAVVPETIRHHVENCPFCRRQIGRLRKLVSDTGSEDGRASPSIDGTVEALGRQFEWLDEPVACSRVRPFLPELLARSSEIRIPTPITVHVDHCPSCKADLAALRRQNLTADQLKRLSRLYRHAGGSRHADCRRARSTVASLASLCFEDADPEAFEHVSTCVQCRAQVYRRRESLTANAGHDAAVECDDVSATDVFDWVVPYGAEAPGTEWDNARRRTVAAHVRSCPRCMEKLQSLHRIIYGIAERGDSSVSTVYHAREDAERVREREDTGRYPIDVDVLHREPEPAIELAGTSLSRVRAVALATYSQHKPSVKIASIGIAAVILIALVTTFSPTASGTSVRDLLGPLEHATNVRITTWRPGIIDPLQETWVARGLNLLMMGTRQRYTLYEFDDYRKWRTHPGGEPNGPINLSEQEYRNAKAILIDCVSAVLDNVPAGAKVHPRTPASPETEGQPTVYEVTWAIADHKGVTNHWQVRVRIHLQKRLPQMIEFSQKRPADREWEIKTTKTFEYLTEAAMEEAIRALFPAE